MSYCSTMNFDFIVVQFVYYYDVFTERKQNKNESYI